MGVPLLSQIFRQRVEKGGFVWEAVGEVHDVCPIRKCLNLVPTELYSQYYLTTRWHTAYTTHHAAGLRLVLAEHGLTGEYDEYQIKCGQTPPGAATARQSSSISAGRERVSPRRGGMIGPHHETSTAPRIDEFILRSLSSACATP